MERLPLVLVLSRFFLFFQPLCSFVPSISIWEPGTGDLPLCHQLDLKDHRRAMIKRDLRFFLKGTPHSLWTQEIRSYPSSSADQMILGAMTIAMLLALILFTSLFSDNFPRNFTRYLETKIATVSLDYKCNCMWGFSVWSLRTRNFNLQSQYAWSELDSFEFTSASISKPVRVWRTNYHNKHFAHGLALKERLRGTPAFGHYRPPWDLWVSLRHFQSF